MGLRDLLKKRDRLDDGEAPDAATMARLASPEFTFIRSDTFTQELIHPPGDPAIAYSGDEDSSYLTAGDRGGSTRNRLSFRLSRPRSASASSSKSGQSNPQSPGTPGSNEQRDQPLSPQPKRESAARRLSSRLHLARTPPSSENVPLDLPEIVTPEGNEEADKDGTESQWEKRATMLARENEKHRSRPTTPVRAASVAADFAGMHIGGGGGGGDGEKGGAVTTPQNGVVSSKAIDDDIQEAIRLHEEGELERSTAMFGRLADPNGANNPLSQVLYGLALRHGWGCAPNPQAAVNYLSAAASNAATVENLALQAGLKKGGAAKGELVLAIFELANCFRHGWGIPKDPIAAKQYYETAANLGDTDAMNEVAWCYLEGFGCKKDKFTAAKYYRLAEQNGNKTLGNTWIWKDKYNPGNGKK